MSYPVIAAYARTPFHFAKKGPLARTRPDDLLGHLIHDLVKKTGINAIDIEDVIIGCAFPEGEQGINIGRAAGLLAGLPVDVAGVTINRWCGSSMSAIHLAAGAVHMAAGAVFLCGGVESMTRVPMGGFNPMPNPAMDDRYLSAYLSMGMTAENVAKHYKIDRLAQEKFAISSHEKAFAAQKAGYFADEIINVETPDGPVTIDGCVRGDSNLEQLAGLATVFDSAGSVTAATASPLTDGASMVVVCDADYAKSHGWSVLARIKGVAVAGCDPTLMGMGPVAATQKLLKRHKMSINDVDIVELNEAFASQAIACIRELGLDESRVNLDGGAIAIGHPLGASGARITGKAAGLLQRQKKSLALATMCIGGGQGIATLLEAV
jgi:acetyl-CoA acyltransferase